MNTRQFAIGLCAALLGLSNSSRAEDIDIYSGIASGGANTPDLMFVIDSSANSDSNFGSAPCTYWDGSSPTLSGASSLGNEQCALVNITHGLPTRAYTDPVTGVTSQIAIVNLGITTANGLLLPLTPIDDNPYTGPTNLTDVSGAVITIPAGTTNRNAFILAAKNYGKRTGGTVIGMQMQETWAYLTGGNQGSAGAANNVGSITGKTFSTAGATDTGCQHNYIVTIGATPNAAHTASAAAYQDGASPLNLLTAVSNDVANGVLTSAQGTTLSALFAPNGENPWGIEWARYAYQSDANTSSGAAGKQGITTYSVILEGNANAPQTMDTFWKNMALLGGGKSFTATSYADIYNDILKILNEVQAVNSVFSSSSLPVSVNAQGTYLNQIYMGMFRPDQNGNPRWLGNLKQYQFIYDPTTTNLQLGDSLATPAISSAGTGFISPNAISFWTCTNLASSPYAGKLTSTQQTLLTSNNQNCNDPQPKGFWANDQSSTTAAALGFDLPDGELVERGGAGQQIRVTNQTDNYTAAPGTASTSTTPGNPRRLYTYCPSGTNCVANLTDTTNIFDTSNGAITDALLGTGSLTISSITSAATVALAPISGWAATFGSGVVSPTISITSLSKSSGTVTATVTPASDVAAKLYVGAQLAITTGASKYDCNPCSVTAVNSAAGTFTYANSGGSGNPTLPSTASVYSNWVEVYTNSLAHGLQAGQIVTISGCATLTQANGLVGAISGYFGVGTNWFVVALPNATTFTTFDSTCKYTPNTATVTTSTAHGLANNAAVAIAGTTATSTSTSPVVTCTSTSCYNGNWTITVTGNNTFTYQYTVAGQLSNFSGTGGTVTSTLTTRDSLTRWVRGEDNLGDEASLCPPGTTAGTGNCPSPAVNVRPSVHGDVLHSRPTVLNYGSYSIGITATADSSTTRTATVSSADMNNIKAAGATPVVTFANGQMCPVKVASSTTFTYSTANCGAPGAQTAQVGSNIVVYYGDNSGVFHAVNGNQIAPNGSVGPGDEMWGFIPREFLGKLKRVHDNSPVLQTPSTPTGILPTPMSKTYFVDGGTGVYQVIDGNGNTTRAIIYLSMRRGDSALAGSSASYFMYALDVTNATVPTVLWTVDNTSAGMGELGQTWSQPKVARVKGYANPVLIFGGGYDTNEDVQPPTAADTHGRAIFVLDAFSGAVVWKATHSTSGASSCSGNSTQAACLVSGMDYAIPADITLMDRNSDGFIDRLYAADMGGNVWRVDLEPSGNTTPNNWAVHQLASLGCWGGPCPIPSSTSPRKFFYPPEVIPATATYPYDSVVLGSGDREHPLYASTSTQRRDRLFLLKDPYTGNDATGMTPIFTTTLYDATNNAGCTSLANYNGYLITLGQGEKAVNAPLAVAGYVYIGTNTPISSSSNSCTSNLGVAKGYQLSPFACTYISRVYDGGGLPPSPVAGVVDVISGSTVKQVPFLLGGINPNCVGADCKSALGGGKPQISVPTRRTRTYWYLDGK